MNLNVLIKHPKYLLYYIDKLGIHILNDKEYLKMQYEIVMGKKLNLDNPKTYNEKLQWLKLNDRKPEYTKMVDKSESKKYVSEIIGEQYIIKTLGLYEKFDDIDFDKLPNQFVLKCTHDSGGIVICKDKEKLDKKAAKKKLSKHLTRNYFYEYREYPYKNVKPMIMAEEYMEDKNNEEIKDYKIYCFEGEPKVIDVCSNRSVKLEQSYFDADWNLINIFEGGSVRNNNILKPVHFEEMKEIARKLSKGLKTVRIDLYEINNKVYFSEITFYSNAGMERFEPEEFNEKMGDMILI